MIIFEPKVTIEHKNLGMHLKVFNLILDGKFLLLQVRNMNIIPLHAVCFIVQHFFQVLMPDFKVVNPFLQANIQFFLLTR